MGYPGATYAGRVCSIKVFICGCQSRVGQVVDALCGTNLTYNIHTLKTPDTTSDKIPGTLNITPDQTPDDKTDLTSHSDNENNNSSPYSSPFQQACPYSISDFDSDDQDAIDKSNADSDNQHTIDKNESNTDSDIQNIIDDNESNADSNIQNIIDDNESNADSDIQNTIDNNETCNSNTTLPTFSTPRKSNIHVDKTYLNKTPPIHTQQNSLKDENELTSTLKRKRHMRVQRKKRNKRHMRIRRKQIFTTNTIT